MVASLSCAELGTAQPQLAFFISNLHPNWAAPLTEHFVITAQTLIKNQNCSVYFFYIILVVSSWGGRGQGGGQWPHQGGVAGAGEAQVGEGEILVMIPCPVNKLLIC